MAVVLDDTLSGEYSNSYVDITWADEYFEGSFNTSKQDAWAALNDDQKQQALVQATMSIERLRFTYPSNRNFYNLRYDKHSQRVLYFTVNIEPIKYNYVQNLQFPRNLDVDSVTGETYIPETVKIAQAEQAVFLLTFSDAATVQTASGITREMVEIAGQIKRDVSYGGVGAIQAFSTTSMAPLAYQYLTPYLISGTTVKRS